MSLEEKSNDYIQDVDPDNKESAAEDFKAGYLSANIDFIDFLKANQKASVQQIIDYLEGIK